MDSQLPGTGGGREGDVPPSAGASRLEEEIGACGICHHGASIPGDICPDCYRKLMNENPEARSAPQASAPKGSNPSPRNPNDTQGAKL